MSTPEHDELLTYEEAGARLKMSGKAVANRARAGLLPRVVLGPRDHRIKASALQVYIDARTERAS